MRIPRRLALLAAGASVVLGASVATAEVAQAAVWDGQWCQGLLTGCINAWSGGPLIKQYNGGQNTANNNFTLSQQSPTVYYALRFDGNSNCIGDYQNDQNDAKAGLVSCGTGGTGEGWGANFTTGTSGCPNGESWFHNVHWNGYLGPADGSNGSQFYLNKPGKVCFNALGKA